MPFIRTPPRHLPRLRAAFEHVGRDPEEAVVSVCSSAGDRRSLDDYRAAGVDRVVLALSADAVLAALDRHRELLAP